MAMPQKHGELKDMNLSMNQNQKLEEFELQAMELKQGQALKRKQQELVKEGKTVNQQQRQVEEGNAVMPKQEEDDEEGKVVKQIKQGEEGDGMCAMKQKEEEGEGQGKEKLEEIKTMRLKSADNCIIEVEWEVAKQFETLNLFEVDPEQWNESHPPFPIQKVNADVLAIVIDFCRFHVSPDLILGPTNTNYIRQQRIRDWETKFLQRFYQNTIFSVMQAANFLNIQVLLDACYEFIGQKIHDSSDEEVREMFNLANDLTPDQEAAVREKIAWLVTD